MFVLKPRFEYLYLQRKGAVNQRELWANNILLHPEYRVNLVILLNLDIITIQYRKSSTHMLLPIKDGQV